MEPAERPVGVGMEPAERPVGVGVEPAETTRKSGQHYRCWKLGVRFSMKADMPSF
ncbi:hypothetical protein SRABI91_04754 [Rhodococcoides fascians]|nr:hypothetical protein SRABI91_04754 [Rhodococcus fascians]